MALTPILTKAHSGEMMQFLFFYAFSYLSGIGYAGWGFLLIVWKQSIMLVHGFL
jgi:hypothetical protein